LRGVHLKKLRIHIAIRISLLALLTTFLAACAGPLFKVKPAIELPPLPTNAARATGGGLTIRTAPLLSDEASQELFEANLPLAGVLAVRVELDYETGGVPLEWKKVRFHLRDREGHEWKLLSAKQAVSRILKANDIYLYNPNSRKEFEKEFSSYGIDLKTPLTAAERRRQGFLFFQTPSKEPLRTTSGLILSVSGLSQPLELPLN
jgi:hypothetical protein